MLSRTGPNAPTIFRACNCTTTSPGDRAGGMLYAEAQVQSMPSHCLACLTEVALWRANRPRGALLAFEIKLPLPQHRVFAFLSKPPPSRACFQILWQSGTDVAPTSALKICRTALRDYTRLIDTLTVQHLQPLSGDIQRQAMPFDALRTK